MNRAAIRQVTQATLIATLLGACAMAPLDPAPGARAPTLDGFGTATLAVTSPSAPARAWFAQGMEQAYAFNEVEAVRSFKAALAQDPGCAMCAWGVAWQLGPNINASERGDLMEARRYADYAQAHGQALPPRERELIQAIRLRYATGSAARDIAVRQAPRCGTPGSGKPADPLDLAYAERLRGLVDRHPDDPDLLSFYAEAELIAMTEDEGWDGKSTQRIADLAARLEAGLSRHPDHVGLNHYMIHAVDNVQVAGRAEAAADRLGMLAPKSPHLLHMPSHTYAQIGRYADATRVNQAALAADEAMFAQLKQQGFDISKDWRSHNTAFQWYASLMEGRGELALQTARDAARRAGYDNEFGEYVRSRPVLTLMRLERWSALLEEPMPTGKRGVATVLGEMARGTALARQGQAAAAADALARLEPASAALLKAHAGSEYMDKIARSLARGSELRLRAELALATGRLDEAVTLQAEAAAALADADDKVEPPMLAAGARVALGDMQMRAKAYAAAEQSYRADLARHPASGWALQGLVRALQAQGRDAAAERAALQRAWPVADGALLATR